jgi:hypothetical protein
MDKKEAFSLLQVPEHSSAEEIKSSFESLYEATKQRLEHAPLENQNSFIGKE